MTSETRAAARELLREALDGRDPVAARPHLVVLDGESAGARAPLRDGLTIGRAGRAGLRVAAPEVSRLHARIEGHAPRFAIRDAGSTNGLAVNGRAARGPVPLRDGDEIALGGSARLRVAGLAPAPPPLASPGARRRRALVPALAISSLLLAAAAAIAASG